MDNPLLERIFPEEQLQKKQRVLRCEDASFYFFHHMFEVKHDPNPKWGMSPVQSIDLFDFSVIHLSTLERTQRHCLTPGGTRLVKAKQRAAFNAIASRDLQSLRKQFDLRNRELTRQRAEVFPLNVKGSRRSFDRTLVVMPFLLTTVGESSTTLANKHHYYRLCFDSIFPIFKNIIGAVLNRQDQTILQESRPFRQVLLLKERWRQCELPIVALLAVKRLLKTDKIFASSYDYIYFTEGDQMLLARKFTDMLSFLDLNPYTVITPHRLVLLPECAITFFNRSVSSIHAIANTTALSCCMDTKSHGLGRGHWKHISEAETTLIRMFGMNIVAGNGNLFQQDYRVCNITERVSQCPEKVSILDYDAQSETSRFYSKNMQLLAMEYEKRIQ